MVLQFRPQRLPTAATRPHISVAMWSHLHNWSLTTMEVTFSTAVTYLGSQCAAVTAYSSSMSVAPHHSVPVHAEVAPATRITKHLQQTRQTRVRVYEVGAMK